jgi:DNA-binding HxlR family transcriptional regulator
MMHVPFPLRWVALNLPDFSICAVSGKGNCRAERFLANVERFWAIAISGHLARRWHTEWSFMAMSRIVPGMSPKCSSLLTDQSSLLL